MSSNTRTAKATARITMRQARKEHFHDLSRIDGACFGGQAEDFEANDKRTTVAAFLSGEIVGYIMYDVEPKHVYLAYVCVDRAHRGEHICQKMVKWLIKQLPQLKRRKITLLSTNSAATGCYSRAGFVEDDSGSEMIYRLPRKRRRKKSTSKK